MLNKIIYLFILIFILSIMLFTVNERIYYYKKFSGMDNNNEENNKKTIEMYIIKYILLFILFISLSYSFFFIINTNKYLKKKLGIE